MDHQNYLKHKGAVCPFCESPHIFENFGSVTKPGEGSDYVVFVGCEDCGKYWTNDYKLVGFTEIE